MLALEEAERAYSISKAMKDGTGSPDCEMSQFTHAQSQENEELGHSQVEFSQEPEGHSQEECAMQEPEGHSQ